MELRNTTCSSSVEATTIVAVHSRFFSKSWRCAKTDNKPPGWLERTAPRLARLRQGPKRLPTFGAPDFASVTPPIPDAAHTVSSRLSTSPKSLSYRYTTSGGNSICHWELQKSGWPTPAWRRRRQKLLFLWTCFKTKVHLLVCHEVHYMYLALKTQPRGWLGICCAKTGIRTSAQLSQTPPSLCPSAILPTVSKASHFLLLNWLSPCQPQSHHALPTLHSFSL